MVPKSIKKLVQYLPVTIKRSLIEKYENYKTVKMMLSLDYSKGKIKEELNKTIHKPEGKLNILFYHPSGLSFGGTEKFLQIIAKHLPKEKYNVYFMYSSKPRGDSAVLSDGRKKYLEGNVTSFIEFNYDSMDQHYPYTTRGMVPDFYSTISKFKIDLIINAGSGYTEFPLNMVRDIPIIMINIFGSPASQKNITKHVCISKEVSDKVSSWIGDLKNEVMYILSEGPTSTPGTIRKDLGLSEGDFIFGRIGRADDSIFDPIGINAFKKVVAKNPKAHYVVMSAPPILKKIVSDENIPNVHFLPASSDEDAIWNFHKSIDTLAHFRLDGESCGLNIAEAMLCGKPIISHRSHIWNAHTEYLDETFSRIAPKDDSDKYAEYMEEYIAAKQTGKINSMGELSRQKAEKLFLVKNKISEFESYINDSLSDL